VIDVELPTNEGLIPAELEEFTDPSHLVANVKLARITGQIRKDAFPLQAVVRITNELHSS
jgi:hypothetical protein